jgi:hypothetical protein
MRRFGTPADLGLAKAGKRMSVVSAHLSRVRGTLKGLRIDGCGGHPSSLSDESCANLLAKWASRAVVIGLPALDYVHWPNRLSWSHSRTVFDSKANDCANVEQCRFKTLEVATMAVTDQPGGRRRRARESWMLSSPRREGDPLARVRALQQAAPARKAPSDSTLRSYNGDWQAFLEWCFRNNEQPLPADAVTVATYVEEAADLVGADGRFTYAAGTLGCWLAAINYHHRADGWSKPSEYAEVKEVMARVRNHRSRYGGRTAPIMLKDLKQMLGAIDLSSWPAGVCGQRDLTLLLLGFAGAYSRTTLSGLQLRNARLIEDGLVLWTQDFRTGPEGELVVQFFPTGSDVLTCVSCSFVRWVRILTAARDSQAAVHRVIRDADIARHACSSPFTVQSGLDGPIFSTIRAGGMVTGQTLGAGDVNAIVKKRAADAGLAQAGFSSRSMRSGFLTEAHRGGVSNQEIRSWTGLRSANSVASYSRDMEPMVRNAVHRLGL